MKVGRGVYSRLSLPWYGLGALVLGVMLARWSWILFAPHAAAVAIAPPHGVAAESGRLFGVVVAETPASGGVALPNVHLIGVFATQSRNSLLPDGSKARTGQPGFAVLQLDNKQQVGVAAGEDVAPGTKLIEIHPDYVLLERAGVRQRVDMEGKTPDSGRAGLANGY